MNAAKGGTDDARGISGASIGHTMLCPYWIYRVENTTIYFKSLFNTNVMLSTTIPS